ncbi:MAG: DNA polymerase Y family protein [Pseudomonadota bacterium]
MLTETGARGRVIAAASAPAQAAGILPGLGFADARARLPHLIAEEIDRTSDARALRSLADWMIRYTPLVAIDGLDGLMLETTGCDHLHGGEAAMAACLSAHLTRQGITHRIGLADTAGAAHAAAHGGAETIQIIAPAETQSGLANFPIGCLRLSDDTVQMLRWFGLTRIGQLYGIDRKALERRFASKQASYGVLKRLDQVLGISRDPISPLRPAPDYMARLPCPEPIGTSEAISEGLRRLCADLCADLADHGVGARGFALHTFGADGTHGYVDITVARPVRHATHILRLFAERLDMIDPGFGIDCLVLEARRVEPMDASAMALSGDLAAQDTDEVALAALADRIVAKLGEGAVQIQSLNQSHIPEYAERMVPFEGDLIPRHGGSLQQGPRPIRLFEHPERVDVLAEVPDGPPVRFVWRRVQRRVARADGPERLAPEWWKPSQKAARARDYYRIEDPGGRRYWIFRNGLYGDGRGGIPEWYIHGVFA